jgi:hypothetical protein
MTRKSLTDIWREHIVKAEQAREQWQLVQDDIERLFAGQQWHFLYEASDISPERWRRLTAKPPL